MLSPDLLNVNRYVVCNGWIIPLIKIGFAGKDIYKVNQTGNSLLTLKKMILSDLKKLLSW